jgi:hypothetical protein
MGGALPPAPVSGAETEGSRAVTGRELVAELLKLPNLDLPVVTRDWGDGDYRQPNDMSVHDVECGLSYPLGTKPPTPPYIVIE